MDDHLRSTAKSVLRKDSTEVETARKFALSVANLRNTVATGGGPANLVQTFSTCISETYCGGTVCWKRLSAWISLLSGN